MMTCSPSGGILIEDKSIHHVLYQNDEKNARVFGIFFVSKLHKLLAACFCGFCPMGGTDKKLSKILIKK
jgi:hypothetical protein